MNKYYTPSVEEFRIGFEYERHRLTKWEKLIRRRSRSYNYEWYSYWYNTSQSMSRITKLVKEKRIRVKYLDEEDIENLGFENLNKGTTEDRFFQVYSKKILKSNVSVTYTLQHYENNRIVVFSNLVGILYHGTIKNKSELKVLLKQLGV